MSNRAVRLTRCFLCWRLMRDELRLYDSRLYAFLRRGTWGQGRRIHDTHTDIFVLFFLAGRVDDLRELR